MVIGTALQDIKDAAALLHEGKGWIQLGEILEEAKSNGVELQTLAETTGLTFSKMSRLVNAYRFLATRRPDLLNDPMATAGVDYRGIAALPNLYVRLPEENREAIINDYLEQVLKKELPAYKIEEESAKLNPKKRPSSRNIIDEVVPNVPIEIAEKDMILLGKHLDAFDGLIKNMIERNGYDPIHKSHAEKCDDLATLLRCISDPEYRKMWQERKEVSL